MSIQACQKNSNFLEQSSGHKLVYLQPKEFHFYHRLILEWGYTGRFSIALFNERSEYSELNNCKAINWKIKSKQLTSVNANKTILRII